MSFEQKIVVVTGGARGIGRACARAFAREGAHVMVNYSSSRRQAEELAAEFPARIALHKADVSRENQIAGLFAATVAEFGAPSILVNNAGIVNRERFPDTGAKSFRHILEVNTIGPYLAAREFCRVGENAAEAIVNIGSMRVFVPTIPDYSASKAALHNLTVSLAKALAPKIRVNTVAPGFTDTDMHSDNPRRLRAEAGKSLLKRYSSPDDIADAVLFMASAKAISITGQILLVDNGRSLTD